jgi:hypothetical protein
VDYGNYLGNLIAKDARYTCEIKSRIVMAKATFNKKRTLFTNKLGSNLRKKLVKGSYGEKTWTLREMYQKYLMWYWRRMEIS